MTVQANSLAIANELVSILTAMPQTMLTACATSIAPGVQTVTPVSINGITPGMSLQVDALNPETVIVSSVNGPTFTATFALAHNGPWTIGMGGNMYNLSKLGEVQDPTDSGPLFCSVTGLQRNTKRFDSGWKVNSTPVLVIESGTGLGTPQAPISSTTAEELILNAADTLVAFFTGHVALGGVPGVYVTLVDMDDKWGYKQWFNGQIYRIHRCYVKAIQQYNVLVGA